MLIKFLSGNCILSYIGETRYFGLWLPSILADFSKMIPAATIRIEDLSEAIYYRSLDRAGWV